MESVVRNLRVLLRANGIIAETRLRYLLARQGLRLFAALIATFGLLMLNLAGYFALEPGFGRIFAATLVAFGNFLVALILVGLAARLPRSRELELAQELHGAALDALLADARALEGLVKSPFESLLPGLVVPLTGLLMKSLKKPAPPTA